MTFVLQPERKWLHLTRPWLLPIVWITGFAVGIFVSQLAVPLLLPLMRGMSFDSVSIVGLIVSSSVPFLISAFAVIYSRPVVLLSVCFLKTCFYTLSSVCLMQHYREGGWLIRWFLMAHENLGLPVLYLFWLRYFRLGKIPSATECIWLGSLEILILTFAYRIAAPLYAALENL